MSETTTTKTGRPAACFTLTKSQDRSCEFVLSVNRVSASLSLSRTETTVVFHLDGVRFDVPVNQVRVFALTLFELLDMPAEDTDERGAAV